MDISEGIKKVFLAGVGAVATTGEAAKNLIDNLVEKGELTVEQGKALNEEFKKSRKERPKTSRHVTVNVVNEYKDVFSAVNKMTKEELEALKEKVNELAAAKEAEETEEECGSCAEEAGEAECDYGVEETEEE